MLPPFWTMFRRTLQANGGVSATRHLLPAALALALALSACGDEGSTPAQAPPYDTGLAQCQLVDGTVFGEPMDPILVAGVPTQACRVRDVQVAGGAGPAGQGLQLKASHQYQPLAWVIDGTLTIGDDRSYASLDEFIAGPFATLTIPAEVTVRALAGAQIIVHRNGYLSTSPAAAAIGSLDDDAIGSGEWAGVVVNGIGSHADCPADTSKSRFCNLLGKHGYYGGLSAADAVNERVGETLLNTAELGYGQYLGFAGGVSEAGGVASDGEPLAAAVVLNAPQTADSSTPYSIGVFDAAGRGLEVNGGYVRNGNGDGLRLAVRNAGEHAVHWRGGFTGAIGGVFYHGDADGAALYGVGGDVDLRNLSLIDRDFTAGSAIRVDGGQLRLSNLLVQNFAACLQLDADASASFAGAAFGCLQPTVAASDGIDHAATATAAALADANSLYFESDPALKPDLSVGNAELIDAYALFASAPGGLSVIGNAAAYYGQNLRLVYPDCMGVARLLAIEQTLEVDGQDYRICELSGHVDASVRLYSQFNDGRFAWVLEGAVSAGTDPVGLDTAAQLAALQRPRYLALPAGARIFGRAGASLRLYPDVQWYVDGTPDHPVDIAALPVDEGETAANWGGVSVYGVDRAECAATPDAGVCSYSESRSLDVRYLRLLQAGAGQPALSLSDVGPAARIDQLQIDASASVGLLLDGGRANLDHLVLSDNAGDQLSWQRGYRGSLQYVLIRSGASSRGQVLHGRNDAANPDGSPRSRPLLANLTAVNTGGKLDGAALRLADGSGLLMYASVFSGYVYCLDIDGAATAALQSSEPPQIVLSDVVLGCEASLVLDDEDGGQDYAQLVAQSATVYALDPQLDTAYLPSNAELPAPAASLDLSLAGASAAYVDSDAGYWGAVADASDDWYSGWSSLPSTLLSAACDGKGSLVTADYPIVFFSGTPLAERYDNYSYFQLPYKICRLPNLLLSDLQLSRYTAEDAAIDADGLVTVTEPGSKYGLPGEVSYRRPALPTIWLLDGMVSVGDAAGALLDPADVSALQAAPVTLSLLPGSWLMATEDGGLHVTRGGRLQVLGEPMRMEQFCSYQSRSYGFCDELASTGPVSLFGVPVDPSAYQALPSVENYGDGAYSGDAAPWAPLGNSGWTSYQYLASYTLSSTGPWQGVTVDGFARNNQCVDAASASSDSQVCNLSGALGHHGGYDDGYENLEIRNLYMAGGVLRFNSVAGVIDGLRYQPPTRFLAEQTGAAALLSFDGGRVSARELVIDFHDGSAGDYVDDYGSARAKPGSLIQWNHGYRGSLQYVHAWSSIGTDGSDPSLQANGREYFVPLIRGANGDVGHEDDLPRSQPSIANLSLITYEYDPASYAPRDDVDSAAIELSAGSGLQLYHAVIGFSEDSSYLSSVASDYCFKVDDSVAERVAAGEFVVSQLAAGCAQLSDDAQLPTTTLAGVRAGYGDPAGLLFYSLYSGEQAYVDPYSAGPDPLPVKVDHNRIYPLSLVADDYAEVTLDPSATDDPAFFEINDYLGTLNYYAKPY